MDIIYNLHLYTNLNVPVTMMNYSNERLSKLLSKNKFYEFKISNSLIIIRIKTKSNNCRINILIKDTKGFNALKFDIKNKFEKLNKNKEFIYYKSNENNYDYFDNLEERLIYLINKPKSARN